MAKKKMIIPRIDIPVMEANGNMSMAWYLFFSYLLSKLGEGGGGGGGGETPSNATISLVKEGHEIGHFTLNQSGDGVVDFTATDAVLAVNGQDGEVVLAAEHVGALPDTTKYGHSIVLNLDSANYQITATLKDQDGNVLNTSAAIDLPLESVVVSGRYDSSTQKLIFTLQNGNTFDVPVGDLVAGLQTEITSSNKLSADLVDDASTTHKFVSTAEKNTWNAKQDTISDLAEIRSGAAAGATAVQPGDLATVATTGQYSDLSGKPTIPTVNNPTITFKQGSTTIGTMTLNQSEDQTFVFTAGGPGSFAPDNSTISLNQGGEAQTIAVKNQNTATGALAQVKIWEGTEAQYNAQRQAQTLDDNTLCVIAGLSDAQDWGSVADTASATEDYGSITDTVEAAENWGGVDEQVNDLPYIDIRLGNASVRGGLMPVGSLNNN